MEEKEIEILKEIKGAVTALSMNNWIELNETAKKSVNILQQKVNELYEKANI